MYCVLCRRQILVLMVFPSELFGRFRGTLVPLFLEICNGMVDGTLDPPEDFNGAFLICLPKGTDNDVAQLSATRPLSKLTLLIV